MSRFFTHISAMSLATAIGLCAGTAWAQTTVKSGPWQNMRAPFSKSLTAGALQTDGTVMFFNKHRSMMHVPTSSGAAVLPTVAWPMEIDAALTWNEDKVLIFSGEQMFVVDLADGSVLEEDLTYLNFAGRLASYQRCCPFRLKALDLV